MSIKVLMNTKSEFKLILLYMNELSLEVFSFPFMCIICLSINKVMSSIGILIWIYLIWNVCFVYFLSYHEKNRKKSSEGWNCNIRRENCALRTNTVHPERWFCPEGKSLETCFSWFKASSAHFIDKFKKLKRWFDNMQKRRW